MFIFYITDLTSRIPKQMGFADDLNVWEAHTDILEAIRHTKQNCKEMLKWCHKWRMIINWGKTSFMLHQPKGQPKLEFSFKVGDNRMTQVHSARSLGVILDEDLKFNDHVDAICTTTRKATYKLNILNNNSKLDVALLMYKAMVRPHLERTYPIWCIASNKAKTKVEQVNRIALLKATGAMNSTSTAALEVISHTLPLRVRLEEVLASFYVKLQQLPEDNHLLKLVKACEQQEGACKFISQVTVATRHLPNSCMNPVKLSKPLAIYQQPHQKSPEIFIPLQTHGSAGERTFQQKNIAKAEALERINDLPLNQPIFFTDGSALGNPGPCGAGVVLFKNGMQSQPTCKSIPVTKLGTSYLGELSGIENATKTAIDIATQQEMTEVNILVDCTSAILSTSLVPDINTENANLIMNIRKNVFMLYSIGITTKLTWIPGHVDLYMNELADTAAKTGAVLSKNLSTPTSVSLEHAKHLIKRGSKQKWQRSWDNTSKHTALHHCRPKVPTGKYKSVSTKDAEVKYIRFVTGHNKLNSRMYSIKLRDSPNCDCGKDRQTEQHILLFCSRHVSAREIMMNNIESVYQKESVPLHQRSTTFNSLIHPQGRPAVKIQIMKEVMKFLMQTGLSI